MRSDVSLLRTGLSIMVRGLSPDARTGTGKKQMCLSGITRPFGGERSCPWATPLPAKGIMPDAIAVPTVTSAMLPRHSTGSP